jgi:di/tricarboxylate transporter
VVLLPRSPFIGRTPKGLQMRDRYDIQVLAINRRTGVVRSKIADTRLELGDVLLVQGEQKHIAAPLKMHSMWGGDRGFRSQAWIVMAIFAGVVGIFRLMRRRPVVGALLVFVTGCITPDDAYRREEVFDPDRWAGPRHEVNRRGIPGQCLIGWWEPGTRSGS